MKILNTSHWKLLLAMAGVFILPKFSEAQRIQTDKTLKNFSVTVHGGITMPYTDVRTYDFARVTSPKSEIQYGFGAGITRMMGSVFGLQADYTYGFLQGVTRPNETGYQDRSVWLQLGFPRPFYFNTNFHHPSLGVYINFSNMFLGLNRYVRATMENKPVNERKFSFYGKLGVGLMFFDSRLYDLETGRSEDIEGYKYLRGFTNKTTEFTLPMAAGMKYKISKSFDVGLEYQFVFVNSDKLDALILLDGRRGRWDKWAYANANVTYKFGSKKSQKEHLEWVNPMEAYMSLTDAKLANMYTVKDADNDGVIDELDWEPDTEEGAFVDTHGRTLDSDGDGIPDHKDPEPFSSPALPIVDGVNVRPDGLTPKMITEVKELIANELKGQVSAWFLGLVFFDLDKSNIRTSEVPELYQVANYMMKFPEVKMDIKGHTDVRGTEGYNQALSERRSNAVVNYLVNTYGIDASRFNISSYGESENMFRNASREQQHQLNRRVEIRIAE
jgi:opacity protein-like surface antigen